MRCLVDLSGFLFGCGVILWFEILWNGCVYVISVMSWVCCGKLVFMVWIFIVCIG